MDLSYGYRPYRRRTFGRKPLSGFAKKMYAKGVAKGKRMARRY